MTMDKKFIKQTPDQGPSLPLLPTCHVFEWPTAMPYVIVAIRVSITYAYKSCYLSFPSCLVDAWIHA